MLGLFGSIWGAAFGALVIVFLPGTVGLLPSVDIGHAGPVTFFFGVVLVVLMLAVPLALRVKRG